MTDESTIRVLIVDDNGLFRDGLVGLLAGLEDIDVVGAAGSGEEALRRAPVLRPDIVLMDVAWAASRQRNRSSRSSPAPPSVC
jgi:DNA-binding NarL/FixJ family response regulator